MRKIPCEACRHFAKKRGEKPNCKECLPEILPENQEAIEVYTQVRNQAICVGMEPVDLNYGAVKIIMDLFEVENQRDCFGRVITMWNHIAELDRLKRKAKKDGR